MIVQNEEKKRVEQIIEYPGNYFLFLRKLVDIAFYSNIVTGMNRATKDESLLNIRRLGFYPKTVIDVGAQVGTPCLYEVFPEAHHVMIEPVEENKERLEALCADLPNAEVIMAGATEVDTTIRLRVSQNTRYAHKVHDSYESSGSWMVREVPGVSLDSLCQDKNLQAPFLIKIDVDGSEIDVLKGGTGYALRFAEYVILEATTNNGQRIFDIINFMRTQGFHVYDLVDFLYRPEINDLWQVDVAFVKAEGSLIPYKSDKRYAPLADKQPNER